MCKDLVVGPLGFCVIKTIFFTLLMGSWGDIIDISMRNLSISNRIAGSLPVSIIQAQMTKISIFLTNEGEKLVATQHNGG